MTQIPSDPGSVLDAASGSATEELAQEVAEVVGALFKAVRARQTYVPGNPLIDKFQSELTARLSPLWDRIPHLTLAVDEGRLTWRGAEVYGKPLGPDNVAFRFFKDGIRGIAVLPGAEGGELAEFVGVLAGLRTHDEDLLAKLWHHDFESIRMEYVDVTEDESLEIPRPDRGAGAGETLSDLSEVQEVLAGSVSEEEQAAFSDLALGEADLIYLRREMETEQSRPLVRDVTIALLDQFEMRDQERRRQVVDILREFLPRLLSAQDFTNVALIVNELQLLANKTGEADTQDLVTSLLRDMSEAMAELVSSSGRGEAGPAAAEMDALLGALQAEAIPTLVRAIPAIKGSPTRQRLAEALDRLVAAHPEHITGLLAAHDPVLAAEAARIVGRLQVREAEPALVELARRPEQVTRQAAIEALAALGSLAGSEALAVALTDTSREVRLAALAAITRLRPEGVESLLRNCISSKQMDNRDQAEQMTFFKAFATLAGEGGVTALDRALNGRRWWGGRRSPALRASAARALGFIDSPAARAALRKAEGDRAAPVQSAVRVALRALDAERVSREDGGATEEGSP